MCGNGGKDKNGRILQNGQFYFSHITTAASFQFWTADPEPAVFTQQDRPGEFKLITYNAKLTTPAVKVPKFLPYCTILPGPESRNHLEWITNIMRKYCEKYRGVIVKLDYIGARAAHPDLSDFFNRRAMWPQNVSGRTCIENAIFDSMKICKGPRYKKKVLDVLERNKTNICTLKTLGSLFRQIKIDLEVKRHKKESEV